MWVYVWVHHVGLSLGAQMWVHLWVHRFGSIYGCTDVGLSMGAHMWVYLWVYDVGSSTKETVGCCLESLMSLKRCGHWREYVCTCPLQYAAPVNCPQLRRSVTCRTLCSSALFNCICRLTLRRFGQRRVGSLPYYESCVLCRRIRISGGLYPAIVQQVARRGHSLAMLRSYDLPLCDTTIRHHY